MGTPDAAREAREKAEAERAEPQTGMTPPQTEINRLTRQFRVSKEPVKGNKYDLSASRYRLVEQDEAYYEKPEMTLDRLRQLEDATRTELTDLLSSLS